jgi:hypothetical protein
VDPIKSQLVLKYDSYDPNTDLSGAGAFYLADVMFNTFGIGWIYHWDANIKFMLYYETVMNEKCPNVTINNTSPSNAVAATNAPGWNYGSVLDNHILTARIQYAF